MSTIPAAPPSRVSSPNDAPLRPERPIVLYWMTAARRTRHNVGLQHALARAAELGRPLVVLEALRVGYRWASDRIHRFVLEGMRENARIFADAGIDYHPYVEPWPGAGGGLLAAHAARAALVVADAFPAFFLPHMLAAAARRLDVRLEVVDGNGLLPLGESGAFPTAMAFRRHLQRALPAQLGQLPLADPLALARPGRGGLPDEILGRWPVAEAALLSGEPAALAALPIDHGVPPAPLRGGSTAARATLARFLEGGLDRYGEERSDPASDASSGLSPWLHFGHLGAHEVFAGVAAREGWSPDRLGARVTGSREGWWGMSASAERFLDELVTWRELGYGFCHHQPEHERYQSLPAWARAVLDERRADPRPHVYTLAELEAARTHDPLWNAAQRQLRTEGRIHNYLRMLWGKKVLEWSETPEAAWDALVHLNNRWALDGRDPNSYSGISWTFGRFDRPWGPRRPIFGTVRWMSSENTARKLDLSAYLRRWG